MEHAPLRPVPGRPAEPVAPAEAARRVAAVLPGTAEPGATALALVALAGSSRRQAAEQLSVSEDELAAGLARARKALRRTIAALPGSGWCERSERLISDRLDGPLADRETARLDAHLRNCPRCVEHERKLVQATDALAGAAPAQAPPPAAPPAPEPPALAVVEPSAAAERPLIAALASSAWYVLFALAFLVALGALVAGAAGVVL